jgi:hypothetical protein
VASIYPQENFVVKHFEWTSLLSVKKLHLNVTRIEYLYMSANFPNNYMH